MNVAMSLRLFFRLSARNISSIAERILKTYYILELCAYIHSVDNSNFGYNQIKVTVISHADLLLLFVL